MICVSSISSKTNTGIRLKAMPKISTLYIADLLTTLDINTTSGEYKDIGVPATILANFLRENGIVSERCNLNSILFLLIPAEDLANMPAIPCISLTKRCTFFIYARHNVKQLQ